MKMNGLAAHMSSSYKSRSALETQSVAPEPSPAEASEMHAHQISSPAQSAHVVNRFDEERWPGEGPGIAVATAVTSTEAASEAAAVATLEAAGQADGGQAGHEESNELHGIVVVAVHTPFIYGITRA